MINCFKQFWLTEYRALLKDKMCLFFMENSTLAELDISSISYILLLCLFYFYLHFDNHKHFLTCRLLHTCTHTSVHLYSYHAAIHTIVDIWLPCIRTSFLLTETGRDPVVVEEREPLGSELTKMLWFCRTPVIITENANRYKKQVI